jgi:hypothetical protein
MMWKSLLLLSILRSSPLASASAVPRGVELLPRAASGSSDLLSSQTPAPTRAHPSSLPHSSFSGTAATTGALSASSVGSGISSGSVAPAATTYPSDGKLHDAEPAPFQPAGGEGTNGTIPVYNVRSDYDYQSLVNLKLNHLSFEVFD